MEPVKWVRIFRHLLDPPEPLPEPPDSGQLTPDGGGITTTESQDVNPPLDLLLGHGLRCLMELDELLQLIPNQLLASW
jgi:hypothetical protein